MGSAQEKAGAGGGTTLWALMGQQNWVAVSESSAWAGWSVLLVKVQVVVAAWGSVGTRMGLGGWGNQPEEVGGRVQEAETWSGSLPPCMTLGSGWRPSIPVGTRMGVQPHLSLLNKNGAEL